MNHTNQKRSIRISLTLLSLTAFCLSSAAMSADAGSSSEKKVTVKGKLWPTLSWNFKDKTKGMSIDRGQVITHAQFNPTWSALVNVDATTSDAAPAVKLYNAYIQMDKPDHFLGATVGRIGVQPTHHIDFLNNTLGTRWIAKSLSDQSGMVPSQSGGFGGNHAIGSNGHWNLLIHNGVEGLGLSGNSDSALALALGGDYAFVSSDDLKLGLAANVNTSVFAPPSTQVYSAALFAKTSIVDGAFEFADKVVASTGTMGYGASLNVKPMERMSVFARGFMGNAAWQTANSMKMLFTVGPHFNYGEGVINTGLFYEIATSDVSGGKAKHKVMAKWAVSI